MGTPEEVLPLSAIYMKVIFGGMIFSMVYNFCSALLRAAGDTKSPLIFLSISGVVNVGLNVVFVTAFHMNVAGVALATIISQGVSAALVILVLTKRLDSCKMHLRRLCLDKEVLGKMLRIGIPSGINSSLFSLSNVLIQSSVNSFGDIFMSGNAASQNIEGFVTTIDAGFYQASTNFVGQNTGARRYDRVKKSLLLCLLCSAVACFALGGIALLFGRQLLGIYITDSAQAIEYGMLRMTIMCLTYWICCLMDMTTGALRGMGVSTAPMIISVLGVCGIRIGWILTLFQQPRFHTPESLFISYPVSWAITFALEFAAFYMVYRKRRRQSLEQAPKLE